MCLWNKWRNSAWSSQLARRETSSSVKVEVAVDEVAEAIGIENFIAKGASNGTNRFSTEEIAISQKKT